jgi:hypothetical protein
VLVPLLGGCAPSPSPYLKAADSFASAASAASSTIEGAVGLNHTLCHRRAHLDYLQNRLMGTATIDGAPVFAETWLTKHTIGSKGPTWDQECKATQKSDEAFEKALAALSAYADALDKVATDDFSGSDIGQLVSDVDTVVAAIPVVPGSAASILKKLGGSSDAPGPVGQLAGALKQAYAAKKVRAIVTNAHPAVQAILALLASYVAAEGNVEAQWEHETAIFLDSLDLRLPVSRDAAPPPPATVAAPAAASEKQGKAAAPATPAAPVGEHPSLGLQRPEAAAMMALVTFTGATMEKVEATRTKQQALAGTLDSLARAETALASADEDKNLPAVLGYVAQLRADVAAAKNAIANGGDQ